MVSRIRESMGWGRDMGELTGMSVISKGQLYDGS